MKKILSFAMAVLLMVGLFPTRVRADDIYNYHVWIAGVQFTSENLEIDSTDSSSITSGKATFDLETRTLTLDNLVCSGEGYAYDSRSDAMLYIEPDHDFTIELIGENSLTDTKKIGFGSGMCIVGNSETITVTIKSTDGNGKITCKSGDCTDTSSGISLRRVNVEIVGVEVNASSLNSEYHSHGINCEDSDVTVKGGTVNAIAGTTRLYDSSGFYINFGTLTVSDGAIVNVTGTDAARDSYGIKGGHESCVSVTDGTLTLKGKTMALYKTSLTHENHIFVSASTSYEGNNPVEYSADDNDNYKWIHTEAKTCSVTFQNWDGSQLQSGTVKYNSVPAYNGNTPTKAPTVEHLYTFAGWKDNNNIVYTGNLPAVTADTVFTATYTESAREYDDPVWTWSGYTSATARFTAKDDKNFTQTVTADGNSITSEVTKQPDCTEKGERTYTATVTFLNKSYSDKTTETLDALDHDWDEWQVSVEPGVGTPGERKRVCKRCGAEETEEIAALIGYSVTEGANGSRTKGSTDSFTLTVKRSEDDDTCFSHYQETLIDGEKAEVTAESGSTVVTIDADTLETLSVGEHTVTVKFDDGEAETKLTVKSAAVQPDDNHPETGDYSYLGLWIMLLCMSGFGFYAVSAFTLKRRIIK